MRLVKNYNALALLTGAIIIQLVDAKFFIISDEDSFTILIDSVPLIQHNNSNPSFFISSTNINFVEKSGNFIINETIDLGPVPFTSFVLSQNSRNTYPEPTQQAVITLFNGDFPEDILTVALDDTETLNGVEVACSFRLRLSSGSTTFNRIYMRTLSEADDHIYGLGEQFTHLDLKGHNFTIWTREQGVGRNKSDPLTQLVELGDPGAGGDFDYTYWPQSSFISTRSRTLFGVKSKAYTVFNFKETAYTEVAFHATDISGYFIHDGQSLLSLVQNVSRIYGRQPELPEWVYNGAILGVQGGTDKMLQYLDEARQNDVAVSAMWIQDWSGKITTSFGTRVFWNWAWNSTWYPSLDEVILDLRVNRNVRVLGYINPSLNVEGDLFKEGNQAGYFLRNESAPSETYVQDFGQFFCGTVDVWSEDAVQWYKSLIQENMLNFGFSGWMADFGEYTRLDMVSANGSVAFNNLERHNQLPTLWARINREAVEEAGLLNETMFWVRSGSSGSSRYATMLWAGDQNVDWSFSDGLPSTITAALSAGLSGMGLSHFDIGGFTTLRILNLVRSKELLLRSAEYAVFTPVMRTHEGNQPENNHQVYSDIDTWQKFGRLTRMYRALRNYTRSVVKENSDHGIPTMRPLFLHYETDQGSYQDWHEYLFGRDLLVAPVLHQGATTRDVYLPEDTWIHLWDAANTEILGPTNITVSSVLGYPPVFYRKDSLWSDLFEGIRNEFA